MKRFAVLLLLPRLVAAEVDGGASGFRWDDSLYANCPSADPPTWLDGGVRLSTARLARVECAMVSCDARRIELEQSSPVLSMPAQVYGWVLFGLGLLIGAGGVGYLWWRLR